MEIDFELDAWFLPGKIHGCNDQVYRIYANYDSTEPSWEVQPIWADQIVEAYLEAMRAPATKQYDVFEDSLCAACQGQWGWTNLDSEYGKELAGVYPTADFYGGQEILDKLIAWAAARVSKDAHGNKTEI